MIGERPATRSSRGRGRAPDDPDEREKQLKAQLRAMSMYASHTSGDGNCLFRALSDQLYGFPSHYGTLRHEICDYLEAAPERFAGFVDIEKPFDEYIRTMRQNGTYGGHLELSAFASLKRKEIKIVQPGLVYVVTGDDDSSEAVAERLALEERRKRIQSRIPPGTEGPPPSARDSRRKKRIDRRSKSRGLEAVNGGARAGSSRLTAEPEGEGDDGEDDVDEDLQHLAGPIEAYGPLYIAYHNWEHYSSIRNLTGPHTGLPRIIERNVSLAAQQQVTNASPSKRPQHDDNEISSNPKPTEHEELILRSVPGHTLSEVRVLLKQHGNLWETVVEVLIAKDAADAEREGSEGRLVASSPPGTTTRSRGASYSLGFGNVGSNGYRKDSQTASPSVEPRNGAASPLQHHSGLLGKKLHSRPSSRSELSTEAASAVSSRIGRPKDSAGQVSTSAGGLPLLSGKTPYSPSVKFERNEASPSVLPSPSHIASSSTQLPAAAVPLSLPLPASGLLSKKRAASKEAGHFDGSSRGDRSSPRPRRRSVSRERDEEEEEEMSVDGALAADFAAHTKTSSSGEEGDTKSGSASATEAAGPDTLPATREGLSGSVSASENPTESVDKHASIPHAQLPSAASTSTGSMATSAATLRGKTLTDNVNSTYSSSASSPRSSLCPTSDSTPLSTTAPPSNPVEPASPFAEEEEEFNVSDLATAPSKTYTYSLQTSRNRLLSPPVSPRLLAARREEGNLSAKEKREIELKRKRDRQRERRAQAKRGRGGKSGSGASAFYGAAPGGGGADGADDSGSEWEPGRASNGGKRAGRGKGKLARGRAKVVKSAASSGRSAAEPKPRKRRGDDEYDTAGEVASSGFVELKI